MTTAYDQFDLDIYIAKILTRKDVSTQSVSVVWAWQIQMKPEYGQIMIEFHLTI